MSIQLNKSLFARNRDREKNFGDIFNQTSKGLSYLTPLIITVFFTPAVITASLFSKEIVLMLANLLLSAGYLCNFAYRMYHNEVSMAELVVSSLTLTIFLTVAIFLFPPFAAISFFNVFSLVNQMAVAVNLFFLFKDVIVPPCKKLVENLAQYLGFDISGSYYSKPPLTIENDRYVIDSLLRKVYKHDSASPEFVRDELDRFNNLLLKLSNYIDKYDESLLGYIYNRDILANLEKQITLLTTEGNCESSFAFIRKKLNYKKTKIQMLEEAKATVVKALESPKSDANKALGFFINDESGLLTESRKKILGSGLECLEKEIQRQEEKIASLEDCLPKMGI